MATAVTEIAAIDFTSAASRAPPSPDPAGGQAGQTQEIAFIGDATGPITKQIALPADAAETTIFIEDAQGVTPSGHPLANLSPSKCSRN
ncbi:MAG UNVERIFIED_CONTAM: hypothetical protein LVR18_08870 [Planctomycetaceae bacterium]